MPGVRPHNPSSEDGAVPLFGIGPDRERLNARIARHWWVVGLRGLLAVALGVLAIAWPAITLLTLVLVFAFFCLVDAVFSAILAVRDARQGGHWGWLMLIALAGFAAGAIAILYPGVTLLAFVAMLAAWWIITGLASIIAASRLRGDHGRWWMIAGGAVGIALGLALIIVPPLGLFTLAWMVAVGMTVSGFALLGLAWRLRARDRDRWRAIPGGGGRVSI